MGPIRTPYPLCDCWMAWLAGWIGKRVGDNMTQSLLARWCWPYGRYCLFLQFAWVKSMISCISVPSIHPSNLRGLAVLTKCKQFQRSNDRQVVPFLPVPPTHFLSKSRLQKVKSEWSKRLPPPSYLSIQAWVWQRGSNGCSCATHLHSLCRLGLSSQ
jgi:hypothetical protein